LLNKAIDILPDRIGKNNWSIYIEIAKQFREQLNLINTIGYNATYCHYSGEQHGRIGY